MKAILHQLYDGEICPAEQFIPQIREYRDMHKKHLDRYENFITKLNSYEPNLGKEFALIMDEQLESLPIEFSETFIYGFRLGAKMAIEIYNSDIDNE